MSSKEFTFSNNARQKVLEGVDTLANAVRVTLGPAGRNVVIEKPYGPPHVTKDGVTVAKQVQLTDRVANAGAQLMKEAASKTADAAGDGTTTATVLAQAIVQDGIRLVETGVNPTELKRGMDFAVRHVVSELQSMSKPVSSSSEIAQVGALSANGDAEVGELIAGAMDRVGNEGVITLEEGKGIDTTLDVVKGYAFDKGFLSPHFANDETGTECVLEDVHVLVTDKNINNLQVIMPIMNAVLEKGNKPLLVIAQDVTGEALPTLVVNKIRGTFHPCAVKAPGFGDRQKEMLQDLAIFTGAEYISEDVGRKIENFDFDWLGHASKVIVTNGNCTVVQGSGDPSEIQKRANQIREKASVARSDWEREQQEERLAKLVGGVAVIAVGAATEAEMREKKDRVEDALSATRAAVQEGIVPGGGVALIRASKVLDSLTDVPTEFEAGVRIVKRAVKMPLARIVENCGGEPSEVRTKILETDNPNFGYNARTDVFEDLVEAGVVDPTKVVRSALQNAVSAAGTILTTECVITDVPEEQKDAAGAPGMPLRM